MSGFVVALLGAESTGKTTLARQLAARLGDEGRRVAVVGEVLREFCDRHGRTPQVHEQSGIAAEQSRRIAEAAAAHEVVVADTTALMIAVYSEHVFGDTSLYAPALADHARVDLTLLTALDLPWQADGLQRDGPHVRAPVDARVRHALAHASLPFSVVAGTGELRAANALAAVRRALAPPEAATARARWHWVCERCGDADCERHRLPRDPAAP
jgi:nicotinamide riboside kinase